MITKKGGLRPRPSQSFYRAFSSDSTTTNTTIDPIFRWNTTMQYQYGWWIYPPQNGNAAHFYCWGNHGQFICVVPEKSLIIVRHGYAYAHVNWVYLFESLAAAIS
ncbi:MAG: hypothetical protein M3275_01190 [Thermoproteota archaeon]|nr:hypothetical protein [Thermoproteota archaeon]